MTGEEKDEFNPKGFGLGARRMKRLREIHLNSCLKAQGN